MMKNKIKEKGRKPPKEVGGISRNFVNLLDSKTTQDHCSHRPTYAIL